MSLLFSKEAHLNFEQAIADFPVQLRGIKLPGAPHTAWQLLEHMRLAQEDILDFSRNPNYQERKFPDDYWPAAEAPPDQESWDRSARQFWKDLQDMAGLVAKTENLFAEIPHGQGQTLLREAFLVADHNAYHLGQLVYLRKMLEA